MLRMELLTVAEDIQGKRQEASQKTNLDMQNFLGISKALQTINGELINNASTAQHSNVEALKQFSMDQGLYPP